MNRIHDLHIRQVSDFAERGADLLKTPAEAFAPVGSHHDQLTAGVETRPVATAYLIPLESFANIENRVNPGVSGYRYASRIYSFGPQIRSRPRRSGEVKSAETAHNHAIHLFRERLGDVPGPQPGLYMPDWNFGIKGGQRSGQSADRISLNQDQIRSIRSQNRFQFRQNQAGSRGEGLARPHGIQIVVRFNLEDLENLVEHGPVLGRDANSNVKATIAFITEIPDYRTQFDGFGSGSKDD
jgi:hypothetical protein